MVCASQHVSDLPQSSPAPLAIHPQVQIASLLSVACCCLATPIKQFIRLTVSGISVELRTASNMNHTNISHCLRSNEDYQDEWREANYPLTLHIHHKVIRLCLFSC